MTPLIVLGTYGVVAKLSNGTVPTAYLVTLVAMLFTAFSYGRMASLYPISGGGLSALQLVSFCCRLALTWQTLCETTSRQKGS
jgi:amino acid transporter